MKEITKIDKRSLANISAIFYGLSGLLVFLGLIISSIINIILDNALSREVFRIALFSFGISILLAVFVGFFTALFGWVVGYLFAGAYNLMSKRVGGIKFELKDDQID